MHYTSVYLAYASKIEPDRLFPTKDKAIEHDRALVLQALNLAEPPRKDSLLGRSIMWLGSLLDETSERAPPEPEHEAPPKAAPTAAHTVDEAAEEA